MEIEIAFNAWFEKSNNLFFCNYAHDRNYNYEGECFYYLFVDTCGIELRNKITADTLKYLKDRFIDIHS